jgi:hypothetical protein
VWVSTGVLSCESANHGLKSLLVQFVRLLDMVLLEEDVCQVGFGHNVYGFSGPRTRKLNRQRLPVQFLGIGLLALFREEARIEAAREKLIRRFSKCYREGANGFHPLNSDYWGGAPCRSEPAPAPE